MQEKKELRRIMLQKRDALDVNEKSRYDQRICDRLIQILDERKYHAVHTYLPMGSEVNVYPVIDEMLSRGITVITPKSLPKRKMENLILHSMNEVEEGIFGTRHPANSTVYTGLIDLFIIPGLAFDREGYRLGYGAGYYDTFLATQPAAYKLGVCYPFQYIDKVPSEEHDVKLDKVLC